MKQKSIERQVQCEEILENISAQYDGEVLTLSESVLNDHVATCGACRRYRESLPNLHRRLQLEFDQVCDVDQLWQGIQTEIRRSEPRRVFGKTISRWARSLSLAASLMLGVVGTSLLMTVPDVSHSAVVSEVVRDFEAFELRGKTLDVHEHAARSTLDWFVDKVDFDLPSAVQIPVGFRISGGRLCSFLGRKLAFIQYEKDQQLLSVYVMRADGLDLPQHDYLHGSTADGLSTVAWAKDDLGFVAIADLPSRQIVTLIEAL